jgi:hypothetical protein
MAKNPVIRTERQIRRILEEFAITHQDLEVSFGRTSRTFFLKVESREGLPLTSEQKTRITALIERLRTKLRLALRQIKEKVEAVICAFLYRAPS